MQCKHYAGTGFNGLLSKLKRQEKAKAEALNPSRYILTTSVGLSPGQKAKLKAALAPFVNTESDIFGRDELNALLGTYPEVEQSHFKLWIGSSGVLSAMLNRGIVNESQDEVREIGKKAMLYVSNPSFGKALEILESRGICVISGMPGIGKTTLAQMIALHYHRAKWEIISVSRDIADANKVRSSNRPQLFLYDDFLGANKFTGFLDKGEDKRLERFVKAVAESKNTRLVLTTREYVLAQARLAFEHLSQPIYSQSQYVLDLAVYTRTVRAKILYNHFYFSGLDSSLIRSAVTSGAYLKLIDHPNFNPRVVEHLTDPNQIGDIDSDDYPNLMRRTSDDPSVVWERAFQSHLSDDSRKVVLLLSALPDEVLLENLKRVFVAFSRERLAGDIAEERFAETLKELEGNFTLTDARDSAVVISFHNPSIEDFSTRELKRRPEFLRSVVMTAIFFEQLEFLIDKDLIGSVPLEATVTLCSRLLELIEIRGCADVSHITIRGNYNFFQRRPRSLAHRIVLLLKKAREHRKLAGLEDRVIGYLASLENLVARSMFHTDELVSLLTDLESLGSLPDKGKAELVATVKDRVLSDSNWYDDLKDYLSLRAQFPDEFDDHDDREFRKRVRELAEEHQDLDDSDELDGELHALTSIAQSAGVPFTDEIALIEARIEEIEEDPEEATEPQFDRDEERQREGNEDEEIARMFSTLLD